MNPAERAQRAWLADPRYGNLQLSLTGDDPADRVVGMDNSSDSYSELPPPIFNRDPGDEVDLDAEMRKQPEDRAPGTFNELLRQGMEFGVAQGDISEEEAKRMFDLMQQHGS